MIYCLFKAVTLHSGHCSRCMAETHLFVDMNVPMTFMSTNRCVWLSAEVYQVYVLYVPALTPVWCSLICLNVPGYTDFKANWGIASGSMWRWFTSKDPLEELINCGSCCALGTSVVLPSSQLSGPRWSNHHCYSEIQGETSELFKWKLYSHVIML